MPSAINGITTYDPSVGKQRTPSSNIDADAFMQLLVAQLRFQDPLKGMDQNQFMDQLATMSSMQQQFNINEQLAGLVQANNVGQAMSLIGKIVAGKTSTGDAVAGTVESVTISDAKPYLNVKTSSGTYKVGFADVLEVG